MIQHIKIKSLAPATDVVLIKKNNEGIYDISWNEEGDFLTDNFLDTFILRAIFGKIRAEPYEEPIPQLRGGWIGNEFRNVKYYDGSKVSFC